MPSTGEGIATHRDGEARTHRGLLSKSRIFGYRARNQKRHDNCDQAELAAADPAGHSVICSWAEVITRYYAQFGPAVYAHHQKEAQRVLPQFLLGETAFTSGIVNRDSRIRYHHDAGNIGGVWSGMLGFKRGVTGGYLAVPEYDLALEVADKSLTLFDGQSLLHGVTPFHVTQGGYRFTVVYYSRVGMWLCLPPEQEAQRIHRR